MTAHRMSAGEASRTVRTAKQLHGTASGVTEPTRRAVAAGEVSAEQGVVVAAAINRLSPEVGPDRVEAAQAALLTHAQTLSFTQLQVAANHLVEVVDPEVVDQTLEQQLAAQERKAMASAWFTGQFGSDGIARGRFALPNLVFGMLTKHLEALSSPRRTATATGQDEAASDPRTDTSIEPLPYGNRLGRALCELIEHLPTDGHPQHGVANATIVVTVDETKLRNGAGEAVWTPAAASPSGRPGRLACNAGLLPIVLSGESKILDLGTSRRLYDRHQRLALATRDQGCVFPGCERPAAWTEAHHRIPWSEGGATDIDNGCLLCSFHHHLIHQGEWDLTLAPDGITEVIPPARIDTERRPIRHQRFKPRPG